jgi:hypothetical protein
MSEADPFPEKKLLLGGFAGLAAAILGAIIWAVVTVTTKYQIGYMAIGVGALVGFALRIGKGGESFRCFGRVPCTLRLHPRKLLFADRPRVTRATRFLLHVAEQCRPQQRSSARCGKISYRLAFYSMRSPLTKVTSSQRSDPQMSLQQRGARHNNEKPELQADGANALGRR